MIASKETFIEVPFKYMVRLKNECDKVWLVVEYAEKKEKRLLDGFERLRAKELMKMPVGIAKKFIIEYEGFDRMIDRIRILNGILGGGTGISRYAPALRGVQEKVRLNINEVYLRNLAKVKEKVETQPNESLASIHAQLAQIYSSKENYPKAESSLLKSFDINSRLVKKNDARLGILANAVGDFYSSRGEYEKSEKFYIQALETLESNNSIDYKAISYNCQRLLYIYENRKDQEKMKEILKKLLIYHLGPETKEIADAHFTFGAILFSERKLNLAEASFLKALEIQKKLTGDESVEVAEIWNYLGIVYCEMKKFDQAEDVLEKSLKVLSQNEDLLSKVLNNLAVLYENKSDFGKSGYYWSLLLDITKNKPNLEKKLSSVINSLANSLFKQGKFKESQEILLDALNIFERIHNPQEKIKSLTLQSSIFNIQNNFTESIKSLTQALNLVKEFHGNSHSKVAEIYNNLGSIHFNKGEFSKGEEFFIQALNIQKQFVELGSEEAAKTYFMMGIIKFNQNDLEMSKNYFNLALNLKTENGLRDLVMVPKIYGNLALIYLNQQDYKQAMVFYLKCLEIQETNLQGNKPELALTYFNLGLCSFSLQQFEESEKYYLKSLEIKQQILSPDDSEFVSIYTNLGNISFMLKKYSSCQTYYKACLQIQEKTLGNSHPETQSTLQNLSSLSPYLQVI